MGTLYTIKAVIVLDNDGKRLVAKYYSNEWAAADKQATFEKNIFTKAQANFSSEILTFENIIAVFRCVADVVFVVVGSAEENELILSSVLDTYIETLNIILRSQVDKRALTENFDFLLLALDELIDEGIILECEKQVIADRVCMRTPGADGVDDAIMKVPMKTLNTAKEMVAKGLVNLRAAQG